MKGPTNTEVENKATTENGKAQTPQPPKHKSLLAEGEAPNSEPQMKRKKLKDELSDDEFEEGLKEMKEKEEAKRVAGTLTPNPRGDAEEDDEDSEDSDFDPDKPESEGELGSEEEEDEEDSEDDEGLDEEEEDEEGEDEGEEAEAADEAGAAEAEAKQ